MNAAWAAVPVQSIKAAAINPAAEAERLGAEFRAESVNSICGSLVREARESDTSRRNDVMQSGCRRPTLDRVVI